MATFSDFDRFLAKFSQRIAKSRNRIEVVALKDVRSLMDRRIFNRGLASNGQRIGKYSTKDILIGGKSFLTKAGRDKNLGTKKARKKLDWVTINGKRLAVLTGGYKEIRKSDGRQTSYVDLEYKGDLRRSIIIGKTNTGANVLGFAKDKNREIAEGNQARFEKQIFALSNSEDKAINKAILRELDAILKGL